MKKNIVLIFLLVLLFSLSFVFFKSKDIIQELTLNTRVEIVDEENNLFQVVFSNDSKYFYDQKTKLFKLCVAQTTKTTYKTSCELMENKVQVLHFINKKVDNKPYYFCLYVDVKDQLCRIGNPDGEFFNLE